MAQQSDAVDEAQRQILDTVRQSQEALLQAVRTWSEAVGRLVPGAAAWPGGGQPPDPSRAVDDAFDLAEQLLRTQRQFAHDVLTALRPAVKAAQDETTPGGSETQSS